MTEKTKFEQWFDLLLEKAKVRRPPEPEDNGPRYADINDRAMAAAVDMAMLYLLLSPLFFWIQRQLFAYVDRDMLTAANEAGVHSNQEAIQVLLQSGQAQMWLLNAALQLLIIGAILISLQLQFGATPGKRLLGLRIVDASTHETPKLWQIILRFIAYIPATIPLMIGILWMSFNSQRRGWHDYIARTVVIHTRPRRWLWKKLKAMLSR